MATHGIVIDPVTGGIRPVETVTGAAIAIMAQCSELDDDDLALVSAGSETSDIAAIDDGTGTVQEQVDVIRRQGSSAPIVVLAVPALGPTSSAATFTGVFRFLQAQAELGVKPRLLAQGLAVGVHDDLIAVADRLRAIAFLDGPNTDSAAAITEVGGLAGARAHYSDPAVLGSDGNTVGSSVYYAAVTSRVNFWEVASNKPIDGLRGVDKLTRTVSFEMGDANSQAQLLSDEKINTLIRKNGWRLWGGLSLASDSLYKYINAARVDDVIQESIQEAFLWAVDQSLTSSLVDTVVDSVNAFLAGLVARGAILGGECWVNKDLTDATAVANGEAYFDYNFMPPPPAHTITFRPSITNTYAASVTG